MFKLWSWWHRPAFVRRQITKSVNMFLGYIGKKMLSTIPCSQLTFDYWYISSSCQWHEKDCDKINFAFKKSSENKWQLNTKCCDGTLLFKFKINLYSILLRIIKFDYFHSVQVQWLIKIFLRLLQHQGQSRHMYQTDYGWILPFGKSKKKNRLNSKWEHKKCTLITPTDVL